MNIFKGFKDVEDGSIHFLWEKKAEKAKYIK